MFRLLVYEIIVNNHKVVLTCVIPTDTTIYILLVLNVRTWMTFMTRQK